CAYTPSAATRRSPVERALAAQPAQAGAGSWAAPPFPRHRVAQRARRRMRAHLALRQGTPSPAPLIYEWISGTTKTPESSSIQVFSSPALCHLSENKWVEAVSA